MTAPDDRYPALLVDWLTPAYDLFARFLIPEKRFKRDLIEHARIAPGQRVLDLGSGTGTLAIMLKQLHPDAHVMGLDGDPNIIAAAHEKASRAGADISFEAGSATALPYASQTFDRVLSTLVMSLLSEEEKMRAIRETYRVLADRGELHIADFGPPHTRWGRLIAPRMRRFEPIASNLDGLLPSMFREAGFANLEEPARYSTIFGTIAILSGQKP